MIISVSSRHQLRSYTCKRCLALPSIPPTRHHSHLHRPPHPPKSKLPSTPARTRFAPSPTGYLHLGSLRTALFNYLLAKRTGGQFLLRIEDTDKKRTLPDAEARLYDDLHWAGLEWDEGPGVGGGCGPYRQSERSELYQEHADMLLVSGHAYRCFCSTQRLNQLAEQRSNLGLPTDYDRACASILKEESDDRAANGEPYVVRLRVPDVYPQFTDLVYGKIGKIAKPGRRGDNTYEDPILLKSDGLPTYHLANVVDDHHMRITHVIRGTEWLIATPKHLAMYEAFGWKQPEFAHVGLLVDERGNKLSKRNFDTDIASFRDKMDIFPEALVNFVALLGWSHGEKSDIMEMKELIEKFTMRFTKGNTTVTLGKLSFLQNRHARLRIDSGGPPFEEIVNKIIEAINKNDDFKDMKSILNSRPLHAYITNILHADSKNYTTAADFITRNHYLFTPCTQSHSLTDGVAGIAAAAKCLADISEVEWQPERLKSAIVSMQNEENSARDVFHYLRDVLAGGKEGLAIVQILTILGRRESLRRLGVMEEGTKA